MAITRRRATGEEATPLLSLSPHPENASFHEENADETQENTPPEESNEAASEYEQCREQRIRENRERLQKLGIMDLSLKLKSMASTKRNNRNQSERKSRTPLKLPSLGSPEPARRSSRLQNVAPVSYAEPKAEKALRKTDILLEEGVRPEFYTEEHEKLLGNTEMTWNLFVDGYRADGTRIYDPVIGKTCHQCRQKTLGLRTRCSKCDLVQGQFCGDCLYTRYGEHVVEANQNPNWICPPCRDICNCSLCRKNKGWAPTGYLYRKVESLGYKSVAHFLIMTKRAPPSPEKTSDAQQSAKRSLPFEGVEDAGEKPILYLEYKAADDVTFGSPESGSHVASADDQKSGSKRVGRPRKKPKQENSETVRAASISEKAEVSPKAGNEATPLSEANLKPKRGRPRKGPQEENDDNGAKSKLTNGTTAVEKTEIAAALPRNEAASGDAPMNPRRAGRPRKTPKEENVGNGNDADKQGSIEKAPNTSTSEDSVARRLRSRTRTS